MGSIIKINIIMLFGLLPAIACMLLCIFLPDAYVIYGCTIACAIYLTIVKMKDLFLQPNIVLIHTFIALLICSIVKITTSNYLIPDRSVPITLGVIIFCFSLLYISFHKFYKKFFKFIFYKISVLNMMACQIIVIFSVAYMILSCLFILFFGISNTRHLFWLTHIMPPVVYVLCIIANYLTINSIIIDYRKSPVVRVVCVNNGNILVSRRYLSPYQNKKLDTPMEDMIFDNMKIEDKARHICMLSLGIPLHESTPRFSLKYKSEATEKEVLLFILPIANVEDIKLRHSHFVTPKEIKENISRYSSYIKEEIEHLSMAAKMWKDNLTLVE